MMSQRTNEREKKKKNEHTKTNQISKWQNERAIERKLGIIRCTFYEFSIAIHTLKLVFLPLIVTDLHWFAVFFSLLVHSIDTTFQLNERTNDGPSNSDLVQYLPIRGIHHWQPLPSSPDFSLWSSSSFHKFLIGFLLYFLLSTSEFVFVSVCIALSMVTFLLSYATDCTHTHIPTQMQRITKI